MNTILKPRNRTFGLLRGRHKVFVAMSGGIDSSVTAALLKRAGFDAAGIFLRLDDSPQFRNAEKRAKQAAKILNIRLRVFDFRKEFKKRVIDCFLKEHRAGKTPNPCVVCNKEIKFGLLLDKALAMGADFAATGHYARKMQNAKCKSQNENSKFKIFKILKSKDRERDQSYFLWKLNQKQLSRVLFPIGDYTRQEVEKLAEEFKLSFLLNVPKSREICFVRTTINDFLSCYLKQKPGKIIEKCSKPGPEHSECRILGEHQGLAFYTIGQRKGLGLSGGPYYVSVKDIKKNVLIVTKNLRDLRGKEAFVENVNWISGAEPKLPIKIAVKIRYRQKPVQAMIYKLNAKKYKLVFTRAQKAITPGQSAVFYKKQELLAGGVIKS